jgi:LysW-gamma-L-alpha-aminoadipyl-6-phosphate/LysW-L-glutamyl-5-phosphate reductase
MTKVAVIGGSGYIGGELLRVLLSHPEVELVATTSNRSEGRPVFASHPNLRGQTDLAFSDEDDLEPVDVLFLATPHRETMERMHEFLELAEIVIDLSGDFRLQDPDTWAEYYGAEHAAAELIPQFVTGLPEFHREKLRTADRISVPGCMATAGMLALVPLARAELIEGPVTLDARTGSSGAGAKPRSENQHAERSGSMRVFAPTRHRHEAEISQATGLPVRMSATGIEAVRGVQVVARADLADGVTEKDVWNAYRSSYEHEPFVRIVAARRGNHRFPDAKILSGSNFCDVGFAFESGLESITLIAALDNLVKGGAGNAVQCMNVRLGMAEHLGLDFAGLHPN